MEYKGLPLDVLLNKLISYNETALYIGDNNYFPLSMSRNKKYAFLNWNYKFKICVHDVCLVIGACCWRHTLLVKASDQPSEGGNVLGYVS